MDLFDTTQIALERAMSGASLRQATLAENLANANTPGYQRRDVDFHSALQGAMVAGKELVERVTPTVQVDETAPVRADGSTVDVDQEAGELAKTGLEHDALVTASKARTDMLKIAMGDPLMGLFDAINVSASGLAAERTRMDVTAENLANAQSTGGYRRKEVVLRAQSASFAGALDAAVAQRQESVGAPRGVEVAGVVEDTSPQRRVYDPAHPDADPQGYVEMANVNPVTEMVDLIAASRSYEANVTAMQTAKQMFSKTLDILR